MQVDCNLFHAQFYNPIDYTDFRCYIIEVELYWISKYHFLGRGESLLCCVNGHSLFTCIFLNFLAVTLLCTFKMYTAKPMVIEICNVSELLVHYSVGQKVPYFSGHIFITVFANASLEFKGAG